MNSDIAMPFNSEPYPNSNNYFISEFNATVRAIARRDAGDGSL